MLCVEDYLDALQWAKALGGAEGAVRDAPTPTPAAIAEWVERTPWIDFLATVPATRSNTSVCLKVVDPAVAALPADAQAAFAKALASLLEKEKVAYDIGAYRDAPAGPAHLVRRDGRDGRRPGADRLARLRLRAEKAKLAKAA